MLNFVLELGTGIKKLLREKINLVITLLIANMLFNVWLYYDIQKSFIATKKKIDHRYFNLTRSMEYIFDIDINTLNGDLKPKIKIY